MEDLPLHPLGRDLHRCPTASEVVEEMRAIGAISVPAALTGLVLYSRAMVSTLFLGYLGELELASGSLSIGFANITGYSVLSGLAMGMEPICGQAFGAKQRKLLGLTLQRAILLLLSASVPISFLWRNMRRILSWCGQDEQIASAAHVFITFAIPDLFLLSFLHPLRVYLRSQNVTFPVTCCSVVSVVLHIPLNYLLVVRLRMGIAGVALAMVLTNLNLFVCLLLFVLCSGSCKDSWLMILLSGLLPNPRAAVASMGILIQTTSLVYVFPSALSFGVSARVGNVLGANHPAKARTATMVSLACALVLGLAAMAFTTSMRHQWGRLFTDDAEILKLTTLALPIAGLCELGNCPQTTGCGVLRGSARPTTGANINLGSFYLVGTPVAVLLGFFRRMGFPGLWLGLLAAQASCATLMAYALARTDWMVEAEKARELTKPSNSPPPPPPLIPLTAATNAIAGGNKSTAADIMNGDVKRLGASETAPLIPVRENIHETLKAGAFGSSMLLRSGKQMPRSLSALPSPVPFQRAASTCTTTEHSFSLSEVWFQHSSVLLSPRSQLI
ncbi:unnamed protein product [Musa banksii]